jgi:hypothetical protein
MRFLPVPEIAAEPQTNAAPALPTVDQIVAKYVTALGGDPAMRKVTSRVIAATQDVPTGPGGSVPTAAKLEAIRTAPSPMPSTSSPFLNR